MLPHGPASAEPGWSGGGGRHAFPGPGPAGAVSPAGGTAPGAPPTPAGEQRPVVELSSSHAATGAPAATGSGRGPAERGPLRRTHVSRDGGRSDTGRGPRAQPQPAGLRAVDPGTQGRRVTKRKGRASPGGHRRSDEVDCHAYRSRGGSTHHGTTLGWVVVPLSCSVEGGGVTRVGDDTDQSRGLRHDAVEDQVEPVGQSRERSRCATTRRTVGPSRDPGCGDATASWVRAPVPRGSLHGAVGADRWRRMSYPDRGPTRVWFHRAGPSCQAGRHGRACGMRDGVSSRRRTSIARKHGRDVRVMLASATRYSDTVHDRPPETSMSRLGEEGHQTAPEHRAQGAAHRNTAAGDLRREARPGRPPAARIPRRRRRAR